VGYKRLKLISHRGNLDGPNPTQENHPDYLTKALQLGFDVELDVWYRAGEVHLGHDAPQYTTTLQFLKNDKFWCHAKDLAALELMLENNIHCFWHQDDDFTLTSKGYIWTYPKKPACSKSVLVMPKRKKIEKGCYGICTDYILDYK
jgi:hypothetical protein